MNRQALERYLRDHYGARTKIQNMRMLDGDEHGEGALKGFGYGRPLLVTFETQRQTQRIVIHSIRPNQFGRERPSDRVAAVWLDYESFNELARHVRALDQVARMQNGELKSIKNAEELLLVTRYQAGQIYADDLQRILQDRRAQDLDRERAAALGTYLAEIHKKRLDDPSLWRRRLRDLIGHGEGIMGLIESYPDDAEFTSHKELLTIEQAANRWRWKLKPFTHRLRQVHGDFHPFNVLFEDGIEFHLLDRSRGMWGAPEDDVSSMVLNFIFFSLQIQAKFTGPFRELYDCFWQSYFDSRPDEEMLEVIQPWFVWRALVLASPIWYPHISLGVRRAMFRFMHAVLNSDHFDYQNPERYLA